MFTYFEEALKKMNKVVSYLLARQDTEPFHAPVDWRGLNIYDYPKIIKKMMDLGTVKRKLERKQYKTPYECATDIRLIWNNCKTYNADGSDFYLLAENISKKFEERYKKVQAAFDTGEEESDRNENSSRGEKPERISHDMKMKLASSIFRLSGMELGHVIQVIDIHCPDALERPDPSADPVPYHEMTEMEINVDVLDSKTFLELYEYVEMKMKLKEGRGNRAKVKTETHHPSNDVITRKKQRLMSTYLSSGIDQ